MRAAFRRPSRFVFLIPFQLMALPRLLVQKNSRREFTHWPTRKKRTSPGREFIFGTRPTVNFFLVRRTKEKRAKINTKEEHVDPNEWVRPRIQVKESTSLSIASAPTIRRRRRCESRGVASGPDRTKEKEKKNRER